MTTTSQEFHQIYRHRRFARECPEMRLPSSGSSPAFHFLMLMKIHGGSTRNDHKSLCCNCRFATIVRGQTLDEEVVHCQSVTTRGMRVTFKVTACTSHSDINQPTYMQLLDDAWILKPASKKRPAGFVKHSELKAEEMEVIMKELREAGHE